MLSNSSSQRGFSLIELVIGVIIMSILLAAGIPSFTAWIQNAKIRTAAESLQDGLQLARAEAVRRNGSVLFSLVGTNSGWTILDITNTPIQSRLSAEGSSNVILTVTPVGATSATFNGLGQIVANQDNTASLTNIAVGLPTSTLPTASQRQLQIFITTGGQIRSCDPYFLSPDPRAC